MAKKRTKKVKITLELLQQRHASMAGQLTSLMADAAQVRGAMLLCVNLMEMLQGKYPIPRKERQPLTKEEIQALRKEARSAEKKAQAAAKRKLAKAKPGEPTKPE